MIFVGVDWAEVHHDVCIVDESGDVLARKRIPDELAGLQQLHAMIAEHLGEENDAERVIVGIETERGLLVTALVAAGYQVFAVNPLAASRYRERHHVTIPVTPRCWRTSCELTGTTTARSLATVS